MTSDRLYVSWGKGSAMHCYSVYVLSNLGSSNHIYWIGNPRSGKIKTRIMSSVWGKFYLRNWKTSKWKYWLFSSLDGQGLRKEFWMEKKKKKTICKLATYWPYIVLAIEISELNVNIPELYCSGNKKNGTRAGFHWAQHSLAVARKIFYLY